MSHALQELLELYKEHKGICWEIQWIIDHPEKYEGPYHQLAVCRNIARRVLETRLVKMDVIYKPRPNKVYKYLGVSHGAGWCREERVFVYWDPSEGRLFHRMPDDFRARMALGTRHS